MDADGNFTVIWNQASVSNIGGGFGPTYLSTSTNVIHGRSYGADGVARGAAFLVHADLPDIVPLTGAPGLGIPALAREAEGNFITAWINRNNRSNLTEYKRYNAARRAQRLAQRANHIRTKAKGRGEG